MENTSGKIVKFPGIIGATSPKDFFHFSDDFVAIPVNDEGYSLDVVSGGTGTSTVARVDDGSLGAGGWVSFTTADDADDQINMQTAEIVKLEAGKPLQFSVKVQFTTASVAEWCVGLGTTDTTAIAAGVMSIADFIGFVGGPTGASANTMIFTSEKNGTATSSSEITVADATTYKLDFCFDGDSTVYYYVDDVLKGTITTNIPNDEVLAFTYAVNNSSDAVNTAYMDYVDVIQKR